ncbi:hypothetical protein DPMN_103831 [Dreissena polymorpha]|uniref:Uncharacterized protein n=1 Tax=Dreissena polymorpha TaxID=45954 RepID=A0A9D4K0J9_DREPO|nr:hypothetical protein DPMN_103831 [Dreissena polymorpha]
MSHHLHYTPRATLLLKDVFRQSRRFSQNLYKPIEILILQFSSTEILHLLVDSHLFNYS